MKILPILIIFFLLFIPDKISFASPALYGDSGFINTPSSEVIPDRNINLGLSYLSPERSYVFIGKPNLIYSMSIGFIPRTEVGIVFNQVFTGKPDIDNPYLKTSSFDRGIFLRIQLLEDKDFFPSALIGGRDIISNTVINYRGPLISSFQQMYYIAIGKKLFDFKINFGYSFAPAVPFGFENVRESEVLRITNQGFRINGFFGAVETPKIFSIASLMAEYDSKYFNFGIETGTLYGFSLKVLMIDWKYFTARLSFQNKL